MDSISRFFSRFRVQDVTTQISCTFPLHNLPTSIDVAGTRKDTECGAREKIAREVMTPKTLTVVVEWMDAKHGHSANEVFKGFSQLAY